MQEILNKIVSVGGKPYFIGGCVRDEILGIESKDIDIEVFDISVEDLVSVLSEFGKVDTVGQSFGVIKLTTDTDDYDFSLPRKENKVGVNHTDFEVIVDSSMTLKEASSRRDFTFNAVSKDINGVVVDPFGGVEDINNGILRHTSSSFSEDALRVLRGFQFCGRFNLIANHETVKLCYSIREEFKNLSKERVWGEFEKWAMKSTNHKAGIDFLIMSGWIECFPELRDINGVPQEYEYHPEGCVLTHTSYVCNAMNDICIRENIIGRRKLILMLSALCHDLGKAETTLYRKGRISAPNHDKIGGPLTKQFLLSINCPHNIIDEVIPLVEQHMAHLNNVTDSLVRKTSVKLGKSNILDLVLLMEADASGRPPKEKKCPESALKMKDIAIRLGVDICKPSKIVKGDMLIDIVPQGKDLGELLNWLYQKQLEGKFFNVEDGMNYVKKHQIYHKYLKLSLTQ